MVWYRRISSLLESVFNLDFDKFSTARSFVCYICNYSLECVDFACLERKWTYSCLDLRFLNFSTHFYGLFGEEIDVLMSIFGVFSVSPLAPVLSLYPCYWLTLFAIIAIVRCAWFFCSQILLSSYYSLFRFIYILQRQRQTIDDLSDWF